MHIPLLLALKLGDPGTTSISGSVGAQHHKQTEPTGQTTQTAIGTLALLDHFVAPNVSVGVGVGASMGGDTPTRRLAAMGSLRAGYFIPLGERAAFWPMARVGLGRQWIEGTAVGSSVEAGVDVQLTYAISDHLYLRAIPGGVAAHFFKSDGASARALSAGFNTIMFFGIGGWF
jgi:hypothetical protein